MTLNELLLPWVEITGNDCEISRIHNDSRKVTVNSLFLAYPGDAADGRLFIEEAKNKGAIALVYEPDNWPGAQQLTDSIPAIPITQLSDKLALIASRFYKHPSEKLTITGVTGTNGKTTIAYQLAQAHQLLGQKSAYIGTIGQGEVDSLQPQLNTTPDALCLQELLHHYVKCGIKQVCMEVSSHALCQKRVDAIDFHQAIFTNLSHEHLDYHRNMENYAAAKAQLFAKPTLSWSIINQDDPYSQFMRKGSPILNYGFQEGSEIRALQCKVSLSGTKLSVSSPWGVHELSINALGFFNVYNALAVFASLLAANYPVEEVVNVMAKLKAAPGRMEIVSREPYTIVDYAHSPDALENVLSTLEKVKKGRIIVVFGCGGDRDASKRPLMGAIASQYADIAIITSDNPRNENPESIIANIKSGMNNKTNLFTISDRKLAIDKALSLADSNDIVLIAGKGHEDYQQIGKVRYPFSDQAVIRELQNANRRS